MLKFLALYKFGKEYKDELTVRIAQGGRLLYLFKTDNEYLGFVNAYLEDEGIILLLICQYELDSIKN